MGRDVAVVVAAGEGENGEGFGTYKCSLHVRRLDTGGTGCTLCSWTCGCLLYRRGKKKQEGKQCGIHAVPHWALQPSLSLTR